MNIQFLDYYFKMHSCDINNDVNADSTANN